MKLTIAEKDSEQCIAYTENNQNVFIIYRGLDNLPYIDNSSLIIDSSQKNISDVLVNNFMYKEPYKNLNIDIGIINKFIWKPGLSEDLQNVLDYSEYEKNIAKRDIKILLEKAQDILTYIEPSSQSLQAYGYKLRELLILACTEVENILKFYTPNTDNRMLKTNDYIEIMKKVALNKYKISFIDCVTKFSCKPFEKWNSSSPTKSIPWYDAYNKVKHDKANNINKATLENCLNAIAAVIILFCIRYSPYVIYNETDSCSAIFKNSVEIAVENISIEDIYIPILKGSKSCLEPLYKIYKFANNTEIHDILDKNTIMEWTKI